MTNSMVSPPNPLAAGRHLQNTEVTECVTTATGNQFFTNEQ